MSVEQTPSGRPAEAPGCRASESLEIDAIVDCAYEAARLLKLLANEKRLVILCFLATRGEMPVGALAEALGLSQSALSQHLAKLRRDGLVLFRRESQTLHYRLADPRVVRVLGVLEEIFCARSAGGAAASRGRTVGKQTVNYCKRAKESLGGPQKHK